MPAPRKQRSRSGRAALPGRKVGILNGPNLNLLGTREPHLYGRVSYADLLRRIDERAAALGVTVDALQSNHEGELIDRLHEWSRDPAVIGVIVNPGGLAHTSVALRDAVTVLRCPVLEVHLTNIAAREEFRRRSLVSGVVRGVVSGLGADGYLAALEHICRQGDWRGGRRAGCERPAGGLD
jgi:3-dehydroquinate dehydratase-2